MATYSSGNDYIDGLLMGPSLTGVIGSGVNVNYSFGTQSQAETSPFAIDPAFEKAIGAAVGIWSQYANIHFTKVTTSITNPTVQPVMFAMGDGLESGVEGLTSSIISSNGSKILTSDVTIASDLEGSSLRQGQYGFFVVLHEIGHVLGLTDRDGLDPVNHDSLDYSIMSYTDGTYAKRGFGLAPATPGPDDIAALQFLYGANMSTNAGNTRYTINAGDPLHTIWDAGGNDIIDTTSYNSGAVVDLRDALPGNDIADDDADPTHPILLGATAVWLAYNSRIEDAITGAGNDTITGNDLNNILTGNAGNDSITGGGGSDQIFGGDGNDTVGAWSNSLIRGGNGIDLLTYQSATSGVEVSLSDILNSGTDSLGNSIFGIEGGIFGSLFDDIITGNQANNTLAGSEGDDILNGLGGNDLINGNIGADFVSGSEGSDTVMGGQGDDNVNGNMGNDIINGDKGADTLLGGKGFDTINGGEDNDSIAGNLGNDVLFGNAGTDTLYGGDGDDSLNGGDDSDDITGGAGNDTLMGGAGNDNLQGDGGANIIDAGAGNDSIFANGDGAYTITGGTGADSFMGAIADAFITDFQLSADKAVFSDSIFADVIAALAAQTYDATTEVATITLPFGGQLIFQNVPEPLSTSDIMIITG
jgi:serralysin